MLRLASQPELKRVRSRWIKQQLVLFQHAVVAGCVEGQIIKPQTQGATQLFLDVSGYFIKMTNMQRNEHLGFQSDLLFTPVV